MAKGIRMRMRIRIQVLTKTKALQILNRPEIIFKNTKKFNLINMLFML